MPPRRPPNATRHTGSRMHHAPEGSDSWPRPWVQLKYFNFHPNFFPNMIGATDAAAGDLVTVMDRDGQHFGHGFYNPDARVPLRIIQHGAEPLAEDHLERLLVSAIKLRTETLRLPETTNAFRVVHSDADGIPGLKVLDLCCYTGGFAVSAKAGGAEEVTGIDLDEKAIEVAKKNANINIQRVSFVHADAFTWMRQMQKNGETWEAVVLDPPKLIHSRDTFEEGRAKYHDLNKLALSLVARGGLFATFSCSGLMSVEEFEDIVIGLAHRNGRKLQILDRTGAGPDHPVMSHCPESRYLKALWARVW